MCVVAHALNLGALVRLSVPPADDLHDREPDPGLLGEQIADGIRLEKRRAFISTSMIKGAKLVANLFGSLNRWKLGLVANLSIATLTCGIRDLQKWDISTHELAQDGSHIFSGFILPLLGAEPRDPGAAGDGQEGLVGHVLVKVV